MSLNVGINGFGRIGRIIFRTFLQNPNVKVSAINDPAVDIDYICYLIKFDSTHGKFKGTVERSDNEIIVDGYKISIFREKLPTNIPWQVADVQYVVEASGMFTNLDKASGHLASDGVRRVLVTAPSLDMPMLVLGVNDENLKTGHKVISCASSTLYCLAPIIKILEDNFGLCEGFVTSIHAMTPSLKPLDGLCLKGKHWRDHRSIHQNIIPASTGACRALGKIIPQVKDKMTGLAFRVPIVNVSVLDLTLRLKTNATMDDIVKHIESAGKTNMKNIIKVSNEQAVSSDFIGETFSCILDLNCSLQLTSDYFKLICWYENEYSYACRALDSIFFMENHYQMEWKSKIQSLRPTPKQSLVQQIEFNKKMAYHQICSFDCNNNLKSSCSTSSSEIKSPKRPILTKKPFSCRNLEPKQLPYVNREPKKKTELFKIWNDDNEVARGSFQHKASSFFHNCPIVSPKIEGNAYAKTQERLEKVKMEFSKMASMTENLLKKSHHSKLEIGLPEATSNDEAGDTIINSIQIRDDSNFSLTKSCKADLSNLDKMVEVISEEKNNHKTITPCNDSMEHAISKKINSNINDNKKSEWSEQNNASVISRPNLNNIIGSNHEIFTVVKYDTDFDISNEIIGSCQNTEGKVTSFNKDSVQAIKAHKEIDDMDNNIAIEYNVAKMSIQRKSIDSDDNIKTPNLFCIRSQDPVKLFPKTNQPVSLKPSSQKVDDVDCLEENKASIQNTENQPQQKQQSRDRNLQKRFEDILRKLAMDPKIISDKPSTCIRSNTITTVSNWDVKQQDDIYDKLDSVSATDSENSFHMNERKSQVINIADLTNSLEDLDRLDKICKIIEISDELSDQLLSALNNDGTTNLKNKKWSFKDLCEKIKLDDFCNKIFSKSNF